MNVLPLLAQAASQAAVDMSQQRAWVAAMALATLVAFLCLLVFLQAMLLYRRGKRPRPVVDPTPTDSVWAAGGDRIPVDDMRVPDGEIELPAVEDVDAADEPFWDAEEEGEGGESWDEDDEGGEGDEPWR